MGYGLEAVLRYYKRKTVSQPQIAHFSLSEVFFRSFVLGMPRKRPQAPSLDSSGVVQRLDFCANLVGNQSSLAKAANIPQSTIRGYTSGKVEPPRDVLIRIAGAAKVSVLWLATGTGPREIETALSYLELGVSDENKGLSALFTAAAKTFDVPSDFVAKRLLGSPELESVRAALNEWSAYVTIPILSLPDAPHKVWGVLPRRDLVSAIPNCEPNRLAAYQITDYSLGPRFEKDDWALVDTKAIVSPGTYCILRDGVAIEPRDIEFEPNGVVKLTTNKGHDKLEASLVFPNRDVFISRVKVAGRILAATRFVGKEAAKPKAGS